MELIKITEQNGKQVVSAKELYESLGFNKAVWKRWYQKNIEQNAFAIENEDWTGFNMMLNGNESKDFAITLEFAKRLAMLARTEKGESIRKYFIECERAAKSIVQLSPAEFLLQQAQALVNQEREMKEVKSEIKEVREEVLLIKAKSTSYSVDYFTVVGFASMHKIPLDLSEAKRLGIKAKSMCNLLGFMIGSIPDPRFGKANTYPQEVLHTTFKDSGYKLN